MVNVVASIANKFDGERARQQLRQDSGFPEALEDSDLIRARDKSRIVSYILH